MTVCRSIIKREENKVVEEFEENAFSQAKQIVNKSPITCVEHFEDNLEPFDCRECSVYPLVEI